MPEKQCLKCFETKDFCEFSRDSQKSDGLRRYCRSCMSVSNRERYEANRESISVQSAKRYASDKLKYLERSRAKYRADPAAKLSQNRAWKRDNSHKLRIYGARRRAAQLQATPRWSIDFFVEEAYALAKLRSDTLGGKWEVDHIVPLVSRRVCGLHVHCNLQVIMRSENARKSNVFWPEM